jgi:hypothetical protein
MTEIGVIREERRQRDMAISRRLAVTVIGVIARSAAARRGDPEALAK